jgi:NAD(P)-dependent dehydrogenase (short-subunit alcohol dehydrogenase family)
MDLGIDGKVAAVGGASAGLGKAVAWALAREGARVAICARDQRHLESTGVALNRAYGREVFTHACDLATESGPGDFVEATVKHFGPAGYRLLEDSARSLEQGAGAQPAEHDPHVAGRDPLHAA